MSQKAYDTVEWGFLTQMMIRLGFDRKWVDLIMMCVSTVSYKVLHNGSEIGPILPERGLRRPYLFILCVEGLSASLKKLQEEKGIHGCKIGRSSQIITRLFYSGPISNAIILRHVSIDMNRLRDRL